MEIILKNYSFLNRKINLTLKSNTIIGLTGPNKEKLIHLLSLNELESGTFLIGDNKVTKENIKVFRKRIGLVEQDIKRSFYHLTVKEFFLTEIKLKELTFSDTVKKLKDSLKIVGLNSTFLDKKLKELSALERKLVLIANMLLANPKVIIIEEPFLGIDLINEKRIMRLFLKLQEKYQKTLLFSSDNTEILYKYSKEVIILNNDGILLAGDTSSIFKEVEILQENNIKVPPIVEFTYLAKKNKHVKLDYHKDIRDIIKDIYKHV